MSEPPPRSSISGIWYLAARNALVRLVSSASFQPASETCGVGPISPSVPALLNAISRPPKTRCAVSARRWRSEEHTSELQSQSNLVCRLLLEKKKKKRQIHNSHIVVAFHTITYIS